MPCVSPTRPGGTNRRVTGRTRSRRICSGVRPGGRFVPASPGSDAVQAASWSRQLSFASRLGMRCRCMNHVEVTGGHAMLLCACFAGQSPVRMRAMRATSSACAMGQSTSPRDDVPPVDVLAHPSRPSFLGARRSGAGVARRKGALFPTHRRSDCHAWFAAAVLQHIRDVWHVQDPLFAPVNEARRMSGS